MEAQTPGGVESNASLASLLRARKGDLIQRWTHGVREDPRGAEVNEQGEPELGAYVSELLDHLVEALSGGPAPERPCAEAMESCAPTRALQALSQLRAVLLDLCHEEGVHLDAAEDHAVHGAIDEAMAAIVERLHRDAQRALRERDASFSLLDGFLESAPVGFALLDRSLRYIRINEPLAAQSGVPASEHIGKLVSEVMPHVRDVMEPMLHRVLDTGEPIRGVEQSPGSGKNMHWLASYFPVRATSDEIRAVGVVVMDLSEQKRAEEELRRDAALREQFLGVLSHDLRNPLWSIELTASTLLRCGNLGDVQTQGLSRILASSGRIDRMVNDLLDLTRSRLDTGGLPTMPTPTDLHAICRQTVEELESVNPDRAVTLRSMGDSHGVWDPERLAQLVSNLVDNALSYSPPDTPVSVELRGQLRAVVLEVSNLGPPIPVEAMPTLFDPFHRSVRTVEAQKPSRGLGLGLFIAHQIARAHGGSIRVVSDADHGTTFTVELPRTRERPCA